ncbi:MAG: sugar phosphate isomerase/epimerase [Planctomycetota bacterium]|nr:MAG: sugar phosphate isomerase/epimerase [Planctomycetota bacterium]
MRPNININLLLVISLTIVILSGCQQPDTFMSRYNQAEYGYQPRIAVGMYIWRQDRHKRKVDYFEDLDAVFAEAKAAGAESIEDFLTLFDNDQRAARTKSLLAKHNLKLAGLYVNGVFDDQAEAEKTIESILTDAARAKEFAPIFIDANPRALPGKKMKTDKQLATQVKMLNKLGEKLAEMNMYLVIHQHDPEILHNAREHRYNVKNVDPEYVGFCLDTHWVYRGGLDPFTLVKEAGPKLEAMHLRNSKNGVWGEAFGPGDIDYVPIAQYLKDSKYRGWLILEPAYEKKTKVTRSLVDNIKQGLAYLKSVFID